MEATEHAKFVGITVEWKIVDGEHPSPEQFLLAVTAPFEQVWDLHNVVNALPFSKNRVTSAAKKRGSMMVNRQNMRPRRPSKSVKPLDLNGDKAGAAIPAVSAGATGDVSPRSASPDAETAAHLPAATNVIPATPDKNEKAEASHEAPAAEVAKPAADSSKHSDLPSPRKNDGTVSPRSSNQSLHAQVVRGMSPRELVSEVALSKDEYFHWRLPLENGIRLEPALAVLVTRVCAFMTQLNYELVTTTSSTHARTLFFHLSIPNVFG
jgi:hypothetical protein